MLGTHMQTLEASIALNRGYRHHWRRYFEHHGATGVGGLLEELMAGMDEVSRDLAVHQVAIAPYFFPHPLLGLLHVGEDVGVRLLPKSTRRLLRRAAVLEDRQHALTNIQQELGLPTLPLEELLVHCGLKFVPSYAERYVRGQVGIDGGAFIGDTARLFTTLYGAACVHALEPITETYAQLAQLVQQWGAQQRICPHPCSLGREVGTTELWGEGLGASSIAKEGSDIVRRTVRTTTIDCLVQEQGIQRVGFIKLDVEGAELDALRGARLTLQRDRPLMLVSVYHTARDFFEVKPYLESLSLGYRFLLRKLTTDLFKEVVLICLPKS